NTRRVDLAPQILWSRRPPLPCLRPATDHVAGDHFGDPIAEAVLTIGTARWRRSDHRNWFGYSGGNVFLIRSTSRRIARSSGALGVQSTVQEPEAKKVAVGHSISARTLDHEAMSARFGKK